MRAILSLFLLGLLVVTTPVTHAETSCELTPLTLPLFGGTPVAEFATPGATPQSHVLSESEAHAVLEMYTACTNTGDPTLVWAMFTPRWFSVQFADSEQHYLPAFEYNLANNQDPGGEPLVLDSVDAIELQSDGRTAVTATFSSGGTGWTDTLLLVQVDGQWLIDDVVLDSPPS